MELPHHESRRRGAQLYIGYRLHEERRATGRRYRPRSGTVNSVVEAPSSIRPEPVDQVVEAPTVQSVEGTVILEAVINEEGAVQSLKVLRSVPLLDKAAVAAVEQWRYSPVMLNGRPVAVVLTVTVSFRIPTT